MTHFTDPATDAAALEHLIEKAQRDVAKDESELETITQRVKRTRAQIRAWRLRLRATKRRAA